MDTRAWALDVVEKIRNKVRITASRTEICFPYTVDADGKFTASRSLSWWTNGFWGGILWLLYRDTKEKIYKEKAERIEQELDKAFLEFDGLHHDVGFMWLLTAVADYRLTGNEQSRKRGMLAASVLASRYNIQGGFIRAWNKSGMCEDVSGCAIIDSMMNIPILHWASKVTGDSRFSYIAKHHADKVRNHFIRADGSVKHIVRFNPKNGEYVESFAGQGYNVHSSWTRGQAWAIYGFVLSYLYTKDENHLKTAVKVADYFISCLKEAQDFVPDCDFRAPKEPIYKDTTAGCIAACGMLEIASCLPEGMRSEYFENAVRILRETEERCCDWSENGDAIVLMGTESYNSGHNIPIIYGDYYFINAIYKLLAWN